MSFAHVSIVSAYLRMISELGPVLYYLFMCYALATTKILPSPLLVIYQRFEYWLARIHSNSIQIRNNNGATESVNIQQILSNTF